VSDYIAAANSYTPDLVAQLDYLAGNASSPAVNDTTWQSYTIQSAEAVQSLAASLGSISAPGCVSSANSSLVAAASEASSAAGQVIAGVQAGDAAAISSAAGSLAGARDSVNSAVAAVSTAVGSC
jgi:hypothetical protein